MADNKQVIRYPALIRYGEDSIGLDNFWEDLLSQLSLSRVSLVAGPHTINLFGEDVISVLQRRGISVKPVIVDSSRRPSVDEVKRIGERAEAIVSVGGGKVIDVGKMAAHELYLPFISIPTVLSNDGIASPIAVIDGKSLFATPPIAVYIPIDVLRTAPPRHLRAGIGDLISNLSATEDWELAHRERGERILDIAVLLSRGGAFSVMGLTGDFTLSNSMKMIATGLIQSGLAMEMAGSSRPASGAEHKVSHAIDALFKDSVSSLHGEQTALGTVLAQFLRGEDITGLVAFFQKVGLPWHWSQIGLSDKEFAIVISFAATKIRPQRYTILEKMGLADLDRAEKVVLELSETLNKVIRDLP